jgi:hypothetical protein
MKGVCDPEGRIAFPNWPPTAADKFGGGVSDRTVLLRLQGEQQMCPDVKNAAPT